MSAPACEALPVTVLTGFLGSGKTTLLNALLRSPSMAGSAVLVNEFGDIGIDHELVEALDETTVLLGAGCLCCTIRDDLVGALVDLLDRRSRREVPAFGRAFVETTGLADPAPILHTLLGHEALRDRCRVDGIVTTVDSLHARLQLESHEESVRQIAVADRLVLTKADLAGEDGLAELEQQLRTLNAGAPMLRARHGEIDPSLLTGCGVTELANRSDGVDRWLRDDPETLPRGIGHLERDGIATFTLLADAPLPIHRFVAWVESLLERDGDKVLRLKGILDVQGSDDPVVVHGVQHVFHPLERLPGWPGADRRSRVVVIARDLDPEPVRREFAKIWRSSLS